MDSASFLSQGSAILRWRTLAALLQLVRARVLVGFVPFQVWRGSLGAVSRQCAPKAGAGAIAQARAWASRVERAASRLPGDSKCLPQAMALQWLLRREAIGSRLVIAVHKSDRAHRHSFHAWVEVGGELVIGHCDRASYSCVASFDQFA